MSDVDTADDGALVAPVETADKVEQAPVQTPTPEQVETSAEEKARDEKGRFVPQERLNEVTRHRREAERRADALQQEVEQLRSSQPRHEPARDGEGPPRIEDFDYDLTSWGEAVSRHAEQVALRQYETQRTQQSQQQVVHAYNERAANYRADNPSFDTEVDDLIRTVAFPPSIVEAVTASEFGPQVTHYLAKHLDEADALVRMPAHLALMQLGRLEAKVSAPRQKPVSNAPTPTPSVGGGSTAAAKDPARMTDAEWLAAQSKSR